MHPSEKGNAQDKLTLPVELPTVAPAGGAAPATWSTAWPSLRLYGEPLFKLPQDLYIPPDALRDLPGSVRRARWTCLLYLIRKQNFNVLDIPMSQVTRQYLLYIEQIRKTNLELAAEYLLMAAMLIEIKSRMLLPVKKADSDEEAEDPRAELVRRLLEYEQMKLAAQRLDTRAATRPRLPALAGLYRAEPRRRVSPTWKPSTCSPPGPTCSERAKLNQHHKISREELSVREHMSQILRRLQHSRFMEFTELFDDAIRSGKGVPVVVVNFIAMLELSREALVEITQAEPFAPIYVRLTYTPT